MSYRLQVAQGLVWVWGDNGADAGLESALTPPVLIPALSDSEALESGRVIACPYYQRELPYAWETFLENVMVRELLLPACLAGTPVMSRHLFVIHADRCSFPLETIGP